MYPIIDPETNEEVIEAINALADRVKLEIKQGKPGHYLPGDEGKMSKADVLKKADVTKKTLNAILYGYDETSKKGLKSLPNTETLWRLCNTFDCELEYLLGFQDHKKKVIGSVTNITGLSEEVVEVLAEEVEFKKANMELGFDVDELGVDKFLEYLILNQPKTQLLQRIKQEKDFIEMSNRFRGNPKSYHIAKEALERAQRFLNNGGPVPMFMSRRRYDEGLQELFEDILAERFQLNQNDVVDWTYKEFGADTETVINKLQLDQTRVERIRVIEDCFTDLVKDYLREVEKDAEK